jgi:hypothetical protein
MPSTTRIKEFGGLSDAGLLDDSKDGLQKTLQEALDRYETLKGNMTIEVVRRDERLANKETELDL